MRICLKTKFTGEINLETYSGSIKCAYKDKH